MGIRMGCDPARESLLGTCVSFPVVVCDYCGQRINHVYDSVFLSAFLLGFLARAIARRSRTTLSSVFSVKTWGPTSSYPDLPPNVRWSCQAIRGLRGLRPRFIGFACSST